MCTEYTTTLSPLAVGCVATSLRFAGGGTGALWRPMANPIVTNTKASRIRLVHFLKSISGLPCVERLIPHTHKPELLFYLFLGHHTCMTMKFATVGIEEHQEWNTLHAIARSQYLLLAHMYVYDVGFAGVLRADGLAGGNHLLAWNAGVRSEADQGGLAAGPGLVYGVVFCLLRLRIDPLGRHRHGRSLRKGLNVLGDDLLLLVLYQILADLSAHIFQGCATHHFLVLLVELRDLGIACLRVFDQRLKIGLKHHSLIPRGTG